MNRRPNPSLERLRRYTIAIDDEVGGRHLAAVRLALADTPAAAPSSSRRRLRHRVSAALASLILAGAPVGAAVAAEDTVPGDLLFPVKQVTERVRSIVDPDIVAEHRVDELETLIDRGAEAGDLARQAGRARLALTGIDDDSGLHRRFERAMVRLGGGGGGGEGSDTSSPGEAPGDGVGPARRGPEPGTGGGTEAPGTEAPGTEAPGTGGGGRPDTADTTGNDGSGNTVPPDTTGTGETDRDRDRDPGLDENVGPAVDGTGYTADDPNLGGQPDTTGGPAAPGPGDGPESTPSPAPVGQDPDRATGREPESGTPGAQSARPLH